ncbi:glutamate racemase [Zunongwangia atlantica]|uniref:Glutamate racemase n=1 Tax=Zunongwangia atlantica 22II14-10F7 TaxID=1185767 RepID=A0A1Y1T250_9FLAO|nr:glutamate racemase [Zunongwangia atlantica]ORL44563.1 glutamate racemase [Zunongwangia atlantica 22II14-10F7]
MIKDTIGIFDSGIGGTSIWREIHELLPFENTTYLADSINAPYGIRSKQEIIELSRKNTIKLLELGAKIIVVACNTATTNAIDELRSEFDVPFIGIEPAIKPAALKSKTKTIGILATKGTLSSGLFTKTSELYTQGLKVIEVEGNGLVELIEDGKIYSEEMDVLLDKLLLPLKENPIDYLVLGCSHYPYLIPKLKEKFSPDLSIIDSGEAVARQTKTILEKKGLLNIDFRQKGSCIFYTNYNPSVLNKIINPKNNEFQVKQLNF